MRNNAENRGVPALPLRVADAEESSPLREVQESLLENCGHIEKRIHPEKQCAQCDFESRLHAFVSEHAGQGACCLELSGIPYWDEADEEIKYLTT